jgi:uncharacterized OsmC-like protein
MARLDAQKLKELADAGFSPQQINKLMALNNQRTVTGSNVVLSKAEQQRTIAAFKAKKYTGAAETPLQSRRANDIQTKYKLNRNLTDKQVEELITAEKKYGSVVRSMTPQEVRELLKSGLMPGETVEE